MSFSSNIKGLSSALNGIHERLKRLEKFSRDLNIEGGRNARVIRAGAKYVVSAEGEGGGTVSAPSTKCPLDILTTAHEPNSEGVVETYDVSVRLGTIGGFAPANWQDLGEISTTDTKFVVARVIANNKDIATVELELADEADGCIKSTEHAPPQDFTILLGALIVNESEDAEGNKVYGKHSVQRAIACGSVGVTPENVGDNCWTWVLGTY